MATVGLPLTGSGDSTASVATDDIGGEHYQRIKLFSGVLASTQSIDAKATTPAAADGGMIVRPIGSTAFSQAVVGQVGLSSGSSEVALTSAGSTRTVGVVGVSSGAVLGPSTAMIGLVSQSSGSSANFWFMQSIPFSSANRARTTVNTSVDASLIAANSNRKALIIASLSTAQRVGIGLSTGAVTTALANVDVYLLPQEFLSFGLQGGLPLFTGPMRGINVTSTAVAGGVAVIEFT